MDTAGKESIMSSINLDMDSGTTKTRHAQWRKLSRKRRRTLIQRSLRKLEKEASSKSVYVGLDDYSHVTSLVFSTLPYNPNGHHCSCNCLDEVIDDPELEVYGWSYGKTKRSEIGYYGDNEDESDDVLLSNYGADLNDTGGLESRLTSTGDAFKSSTYNRSALDEESDKGNETARSFMGGSLDLKLDSIGRNDLISPRKETGTTTDAGISQRSSTAITDTLGSAGNPTTRGKSGTLTRKGCLCDKVISRPSASRNSITSEMSMLLPRTTCSKCQHLLTAAEKFRSLHSSRRISLAKDEGLLRSKIFGLRQKLRQYDTLIKKKEYLTVQQKVKRKLTILDAQQRQALRLSDNLKLMKVQEYLYRYKNKDLQKRLDEDDCTREEDEEERIGHDWRVQKADKHLYSGSRENSFNRSFRKTGRSTRGTGLPALFEEDEDIVRETHSSGRRIEDYHRENMTDRSGENPYDILFVNHSDNEVEFKDKSNDGDYFDEDDDELMRTWPAFKRDSLKLDLWRLDGTESSASNRTVKLRKSLRIDPVRRLVHRLDSGLSFGVSSPDREIVDDKSFLETKNILDEEKLIGSKLSEDEYYKPLTKRQKSFGDGIRQIIKQEIARRSSLTCADQKERESMSEISSEKKDFKTEVSRRRSLVNDENNLRDFVEVAEMKNEILQQQLRKRSENERRDYLESEESNSLESGEEGIEKRTEEKIDSFGPSSSNISDNIITATQASNGVRGKFLDLSTLRTLAQKHKTLQSLGRLDEELYRVTTGTEKLNSYRKCEAKARVQKENRFEDDEVEADLPLSAKEKKFSIPAPQNKMSIVEQEIAENEKQISRINFEYDTIRDLRHLILNQNTSRATSYSYFQPAPPYLKKKWQSRIKRGFLRGVKEQKVNEKQLETVENVTLKTLDRNEIHKETLKNKKKERKKSSDLTSQSVTPGPSRLSITRKNSITSSNGDAEKDGHILPPLKLPGSRTSSPDQASYENYGNQPKANDVKTLRNAFRKLSMRHKFVEKTGLMKSVIRLSSYSKNESNETLKSLDSSRSFTNSDTADQFTSRLKQHRRHSVAAQNFATSDPLSGRISVSSVDKRRFSLMQPIHEI